MMSLFRLQTKIKFNKKMKMIVLSIATVSLMLTVSCTHSTGSSSDATATSYQEKIMSVEEIERSQPTNFLTADGTYNSNFWGDKIKVHGTITNSATVASYKDALVRVTYYSKTKTVLGTKEYTIYDFFPAHSTKKFELKIDNYQDVSSIGWDVISAVPN